MIVRNFRTTPAQRERSHDGAGEPAHVKLYDSVDFASNLRFIIHTRIAPGESIGYHRHGDDEEVYAVLDGEGVMTVNGEERAVAAGDVILNKPQWSHALANRSDRTLEILVFEVKR